MSKVIMRVIYVFMFSIICGCSPLEKPTSGLNEDFTAQDTLGSYTSNAVEDTKAKKINHDQQMPQVTAEKHEGEPISRLGHSDSLIRASSNIRTSSCKKCSFEILATLEETKSAPLKSSVSSFVCTFSKVECANNVEFEEFYVELLFDLLAYSTTELLESLAETSPGKRYSIIQMMENPVNDLHSMSELVNTVGAISAEMEVKTLVLKALGSAKSKMN